MTDKDASWRPSASLHTLQQRARILAAIRAFFNARGVMEVETPALSHGATVDPHIESFRVASSDTRHTGYLHTSPEFAMKRLLAAGSGAIYQLAKVFRAGEEGRRHQPEFTLLEWYRPGFGLTKLMDEVEALLQGILHEALTATAKRFSYREAFLLGAGMDPFTASVDELMARCAELQVHGLGAADDRDVWLDLLMAGIVEPALPKGCLVIVYDYPASQAALARVRRGNPDVAERFEVFVNGMELANGFYELRDSTEQRRRFEADLTLRRLRGQTTPPLDEHLLQALVSGLPDCAGVAVGVDRLVMLAVGADHIEDVVSFTFARA